MSIYDSIYVIYIEDIKYIIIIFSFNNNTNDNGIL